MVKQQIQNSTEVRILWKSFFEGDFARGRENKKRFNNNRTKFNAGTRLD